mgnify:CR=1 FL=1
MRNLIISASPSSARHVNSSHFEQTYYLNNNTEYTKNIPLTPTNIDKTSYTPIEISREDLAILYEAIDLTMKKQFPQHYENKDLSPDIPVGQYFALVIGNYDYE